MFAFYFTSFLFPLNCLAANPFSYPNAAHFLAFFHFHFYDNLINCAFVCNLLFSPTMPSTLYRCFSKIRCSANNLPFFVYVFAFPVIFAKLCLCIVLVLLILLLFLVKLLLIFETLGIFPLFVYLAKLIPLMTVDLSSSRSAL